jgi:hypothetical protein
VTDPDALAAALIEQDGDRHERYDEFRITFCHLEDGHATDRVLEQLGLL